MVGYMVEALHPSIWCWMGAYPILVVWAARIPGGRSPAGMTRGRSDPPMWLGYHMGAGHMRGGPPQLASGGGRQATP